ncbi:DUF1642 domain-containing protein [Streptococcus mitis]|uniref:DUF1642 domain-containing protein n=1 Tax=Streptococcus mitis TaxID=28037 RepID=UPI00352EA31A
MKVQRLIEKYKELYENVFDFGAKLACQLILQDLEQLDELETGHADEAPRYLKNILARLRELPDHDREVWLKAIMGEFKEDFSHVKWREGYEQGKFEGEWVGNQLKDADKIRQELNKVLLPNFMDDWIFECQLLKNFSLRDALDSNTIHLYAKKSEFVKKWLNDKNNQELFARAWLTDYEAEKEPKYKVKLKNTDDYLNQTETGFHFFNNWKNNEKFTRKELEYSGFGEVFNSPLFEVEEVE